MPYLSASIPLLVRRRVVWLLLLFAAEAYTGAVLRAFDDEIAKVVALSYLIPLLIGTGGNIGSQTTTTLVRALGWAKCTCVMSAVCWAKRSPSG